MGVGFPEVAAFNARRCIVTEAGGPSCAMHATLPADPLICEALAVRSNVRCGKRLRYLGDDVGGDVLDASHTRRVLLGAGWTVAALAAATKMTI